MTADIALLQRVQDTYALVTGLTLWMTSVQGERITRPSGSEPWIADACQTGNTHSHLDEWLESQERNADYRSDSGFTFRPDIKLYVSAVQLGQSVRYWVWGAWLSEQPQNGSNPQPEQLDKLKELAETAASLLGALDLHKRFDRRVEQVRELLEEQEQTAVPLEALTEMAVHMLTEAADEFTLIGYAEKVDATTYVVKHSNGEKGKLLEGASFTLGEGLLGQAATTRQPGVWENMRHDPRASFFISRGIEPKMVFALPIHYDDEMVGLLFGLNTAHPGLPDDLLKFSRIVSSLLGLRLAERTLLADRNLNFIQLTTLMDMFKTLPSIREVKRVLFILIDMAINIAEAVFACVGCRQPDGRLQMVSRGLAREETASYLTQLTERFGAGNVEGDDEPTVVYRNDEPVLEFPLSYRGESFGVFAVGLKSLSDTDNFRDYMASMAVIGSVALYRLIHEQDAAEQTVVAEAIRQTLRQWDSTLFEQSEQALSLVESYSREQGLEADASCELANLCRLAPFQTPVLTEDTLRPRLRVLHAEMRSLLEEKPNVRQTEVSEAAQIAVLAWLQAEGKLVPNNDPRYSAVLTSRFREHAERRHVIELEIDTSDAAVAAAEPLAGTTDLMEPVRALGLLSKREMDVLGLVAIGCSNREIAEKLWISEHTVKNHMTNILAKLGAVDRTQLVAKVYQLGFPGSDLVNSRHGDRKDFL